MRSFIFLFSVLTFSTLEAAPLSLREAVQIALKNSPSLDSKRRDLNISQYKVEDKFAQFLPQLGFKSEHGLDHTVPRRHHNDWRSQAEIELLEKLYDSGRSQSQYSIAKLQRESTDIALSEQRDLLILNVILQFLQVSLKTSLVEGAENKHKAAKKQFDFTNDVFRQGLKRRSDVMRFKAQMERSELAFEQSKVDLALAISSLKVVLGKNSDEAIEFAPFDIEKDGTSFASLIKSSPVILEDYYSVRRLTANKKVQEEKLDLARSVNTPEINLRSSIKYRAENYIGTRSSWDDRGWNYFVGIEVNIPIWDWGINKRNILSNSEQLYQKENDIRAERNSLSDKVTTVHKNLALAEKSYMLIRDLVKIEQDNYTQLDLEYKTAKVSVLDLITATDNLATANTALLQTLYDKIGFQAQLLFYQGRIYDWTHL